MPLVTIGVASYNNSSYIIETLDSINNQSYREIELVIVDDCSDDNSIILIEQWLPTCGIPVSLIKNHKNVGISKTCNILLKNASPKSKYFALFGSDDIMETRRIDYQVKALECLDESFACVFSDMLVINKEGETIKNSYYDVLKENSSSYSNFLKKERVEQVEYMILKNIFPAPSVLYRKNILESEKGWDENLYFEDWDMHLRLVNKGFKFHVLEEKLIKYRILPDSPFRKQSSKYWESYLKLISKYRTLSKRIDIIIDNEIKNHALSIYQLGGKRSWKWLGKKLTITKDKKTCIYFILAFLNIPYLRIQESKIAFKKLLNFNRQ